MVDVKGRWAFITGASRGVGYEIALFMAKQGCNLILHSRSLEHTLKVKEEAEALGVKVHCVEAELAEHEAVVNMLDEIEALNVAVDLVFNNAGVQVAYRHDYWKTPVQDFDLSFKINFIAITTICYRLIPKMIARGFGRVINTTSGIQNEPQQAGYSASKAALDKFTRDLGSKLEGTNVVISLSDPGWCRTDLGGPYAPNAVEDAIPGVVVGAFVDDQRSGRYFAGPEYKNMSLRDAVAKAMLR